MLTKLCYLSNLTKLLFDELIYYVICLIYLLCLISISILYVGCCVFIISIFFRESAPALHFTSPVK